MRSDLGLEARLLLRPRGIAGVVGTLAGAGALVSAYLPWYQVTAEVDLLGSTSRRAVADLAGWEAHPWGWVVPALAIVAMLVAAGLAMDRPLPFGRDAQLAAGFAIASTVAVGGLLFPPVSRFDVAGSRLRELVELADRLPGDVSLSFAVRPGAGMWSTLASAALLVATALAVRDLL